MFSDCKAISPPVNGDLSTNSTIINTTVDVTCGAGYTLFGDEVLQCLTTGLWNGTVGQCWKGKASKFLNNSKLNVPHDSIVWDFCVFHFIHVVPCMKPFSL